MKFINAIYKYFFSFRTFTHIINEIYAYSSHVLENSPNDFDKLKLMYKNKPGIGL